MRLGKVKKRVHIPTRIPIRIRRPDPSRPIPVEIPQRVSVPVEVPNKTPRKNYTT